MENSCASVSLCLSLSPSLEHCPDYCCDSTAQHMIVATKLSLGVLYVGVLHLRFRLVITILFLVLVFVRVLIAALTHTWASK